MTDKEMASNYADTVKCEWENDTYWVDCRDKIEDAFLAGLKAGKPKWHKVADGDLPKNKGAVLSDKGEFVYYNSFAQNLVDETYTEQTDIIAWCEIPKYTEE